MLAESPQNAPLPLSEGAPVAQFEIGDYRNFVYLILDWNTKKAAIIDPQEDLSKPLLALETHGFQLERVLLTHTHFDHIAGVQELIEKFSKLPLHVHSLDRHRLKEKGPDVWSACCPTEDEEQISVGQLQIQALHTPGHSAGEICYRLETSENAYLFSGDTLFIRDCGRTDLETGSNEQMFQSLQKIKKLDPKTVILPGHHYVKEYTSTLSRELETNPPLQCKSVRELEALP